MERSALKIHTKLVSVIIILLHIPFSPAFSQNAQRNQTENRFILNVGFSKYKPASYLDATGKPVGIYVDILQHIANSRNWNVNYVSGNWSDLYQMLIDGDIDLLLNMAVTDRRKEHVLFGRENLFNSWAEIVVPEDSDIRSIPDLAGKRIASLKGSNYTDGVEGIKVINERYELGCTIVEVQDGEGVVQEILNDNVDAMAVGKLRAYESILEYDLKRSGIVFAPVPVHYGVSKKNAEAERIVNEIDHDISLLKNDPESEYYKAFERYLVYSTISTVFRFPDWLKWILISGGVFTVFVIINSILLRRQVKTRTRDLIRANVDLSKSEEKFSKAFLMGPDAITISSLDIGRFIEVNDSFIKMSGFSREEPIGKTTLEVGLWYEPSHRESFIAKIKKEGILRDEYVEFVRKSGEKLRCLISADRIDLGGQDCLLLIARDVTVKFEQEEKLRKSEERLRKIYNDGPIGIGIIDRKMNITSINSYLADLFGVDGEEFRGTHISKTSPEEDLEELIDINEKIFAGKLETYQSENQFIINGKETWAKLTRSALHDSEGKPEYIIGIFDDITEQKIAQKALEESERKYKAMFNQSFSLIGLLDLSGKMLEVNDTAVKFAGINYEDAIGKHFADTPWWSHSEEERKRVRGLVDKAAAGESTRFESTNINAEGLTEYFDVSITPVFDEKGKVVAIIPEGRSIDELKQKERELYEAGEKERALIASSNTGAWEYNTETGTAWCSPEYFTMLGRNIEDFDFDSDDVLERIWFDFIHPEDCEKTREKIFSYFKNPVGMYNNYFRMRHKNGHWVWIWSRGMTLHDKNGNSTGITIGSHIDITEQKESEERLRFSEMRLKEAQSMAQLGHWEYYFDTRKITWSDEVFRIYEIGRDQFDMSMETVLNRIHPEDRDILEKSFEESANSLQQFDLTYRLLFWDGRIKWIHTKFRSEFDTGKRPVRILGTTQDITEVKSSEIEKKKLELQLHQAQKMEAIGQLAGGIAHDFNNILAVIMGASDIVKMRLNNSDPEIIDFIDDIYNASNRAKDLVRQILTFSRKTETSKKPLQISLLIKEAFKLLRASIPSTIQMQLNITNTECRVEADPTKINQIIMNLCTNAAFAMGNEGGVLSIGLDSIEVDASGNYMDFNLLPGKYVMLQISDTGTGITMETLDRIFEPYFTTKPPEDGTGLGLAVVHGIVLDHDGSIFVESEVGSGSTFYVFLPEYTHDTVVSDQGSQEVKKGYGKILLVDDETNILKIYSSLLSSLGFQVEAVSNSEKAYEMFKQNVDNFDIIITDQTMPNMTGLQLAEKILKARPGIPVLLSTGYSESIDKEKVEEIGVQRIMYKPLSAYELSKAIEEILNKR